MPEIQVKRINLFCTQYANLPMRSLRIFITNSSCSAAARWKYEYWKCANSSLAFHSNRLWPAMWAEFYLPYFEEARFDRQYPHLLPLSLNEQNDCSFHPDSSKLHRGQKKDIARSELGNLQGNLLFGSSDTSQNAMICFRLFWLANSYKQFQNRTMLSVAYCAQFVWRWVT